MFSRRKRNQRKTKGKITKEMYISFLLVFLFVFVCISFVYVFQTYTVRANFEKDVLAIATANKKQVFSLDKIFLFSSSDAIRNENPKALWDLNIYQYTDIAIYLNNYKNGLSKENTIKELYLDQIQYTYPSLGTPSLYFKNIEEFGKSSLLPDKEIKEKLIFNIISGDQEVDLNTPTLYNTGNTPITLEYINQNIKENAIISNTQEALVFDGTLLKKANIPLTDIQNTISFKLHIINNLEEHFVCNVSIPIPLEDMKTNESILNGSIKQELTNLSNIQFYKSK